MVCDKPQAVGASVVSLKATPASNIMEPKLGHQTVTVGYSANTHTQ
jgi:hypothetical protein